MKLVPPSAAAIIAPLRHGIRAALSWRPRTGRRAPRAVDHERADGENAARIPARLFRENLVRLRSELQRGGMRPIVVMGDPGSGKSSLILRLCGGACTPKPVIAASTDSTDWSCGKDVPLWHRGASRVFVDLPGTDTERHPVNDLLELFPFELVDTLLIVIRGKPRSSTAAILARARQLVDNGQLAPSRVSVVRTFLDEIDAEHDLDDIRSDLRVLAGQAFPIVFVSNRSGLGLDELRSRLELETSGREKSS